MLCKKSFYCGEGGILHLGTLVAISSAVTGCDPDWIQTNDLELRSYTDLNRSSKSIDYNPLIHPATI